MRSDLESPSFFSEVSFQAVIWHSDIQDPFQDLYNVYDGDEVVIGEQSMIV